MISKKSTFSKDWSPYIVGMSIGILSCFSFYVVHQMLGASTTFVHAAAALESLFNPGTLKKTAYYAKTLKESPLFDWQACMICFVFIGAWVANRSSGKSAAIWVPKVWEKSFGPSRIKRLLFAFLGGALLVFGARLAGGCTSGHAISGGMQFALSSWIFLISLFVSGVAAASMLYKS